MATISEDGAWIAIGANNIAQVWRSSHLDQAPWVIRSDSQITNLSFSPGHRELIIGSYGGDVGLYGLTANGPAQFATLRAHDGSVRFVGFSREGNRAFSGSYRQLRFWELRVDDLLKTATVAVGRKISESEWHSYFPGENYRRTFEINGSVR